VPFGVCQKVKKYQIRDQKVKLTIWDTAGQERFRSVTSSYYLGAHGVCLGICVPCTPHFFLTTSANAAVFDVTRRQSLLSLDSWLQEVRQFSLAREPILILVGNKIDLTKQREVTQSEAQEWATRNGTMFIETSAKTNEGIAQAFAELVTKILDTPALTDPDADFKAMKASDIHAVPTPDTDKGSGCPC